MMKDIHLHRRYSTPTALMRNLLALALIGGAVTVVGINFVPARAFPNLLLSAVYLLGLGVAGAVFVALQYVSNAGWSVAIRRVPEAMIDALPAGGILLLVTLSGIHTLYEWSDEVAVATDSLLQAKSFWLNVPFFTFRTLFYLSVWTGVAALIVRASRAQDGDGRMLHTMRNRRYSAILLVIVGLTFGPASMDWIMSLEPHWYSTIFGVYNISGMFLSGLAAITMITVFMRRSAAMRDVISESHLHQLGKLLFAFSTFWMYIGFSQYLLVWYANIPEEVTYFVRRQHGSWLIFTVVNVVFNWLIPFIVLLPSWTKKNEGVLLRVCAILLIGRWIDLFWMIFPPFMPEAPVVNIWEIAAALGMLALFFYLVLSTFSRSGPVPIRDPMLVESLTPQEH